MLLAKFSMLEMLHNTVKFISIKILNKTLRRITKTVIHEAFPTASIDLLTKIKAFIQFN